MQKRSMGALVAIAAAFLAAGAPRPAAAAPDRSVWVTQTQLGISGESTRPQAIAATAGGDVWVAGYVYTGLEFRTLALRRHAGSWSRIDTPDVETAPAQDFLYGVAAVSPANVWMVGSSAVSATDLADKPLVEHWDGTSVSIVPVPDPAGGTGASLQAVSGTASDLWAVGTTRSASFADVAMAMHFDGRSWTSVPFPVVAPGCGPALDSDLLSVVDLGHGQVYAGGWCRTPQDQIGFIEHLVGGQWQLAAITPPTGEVDSLTAAPGDTVWAAGSQQSTGGGAGWLRGVAFGGRGSHLVPVDQPVPVDGVYTGFAGVVATASSVLAVGTGTSPQPPFAGFGAYSLAGSRWVAEPVRDPFGGFGRFSATTVDSSGDVLATGFGIDSSGSDVAVVSVRRP